MDIKGFGQSAKDSFNVTARLMSRRQVHAPVAFIRLCSGRYPCAQNGLYRSTPIATVPYTEMPDTKCNIKIYLHRTLL